MIPVQLTVRQYQSIRRLMRTEAVKQGFDLSQDNWYEIEVPNRFVYELLQLDSKLVTARYGDRIKRGPKVKVKSNNA
jgi:hypothetical protein